MAETLFYYAEGTEQRGPYTLEQLYGFSLTPDTLVWYQGLNDWTRAADAPLTAVLFRKAAAPEPRRFEAPRQTVAAAPHPYEPREPRVEDNYPQPTENDRETQPALRTDSNVEDYIPTHLNWAVWGMVLCFPFGIPSLVNATRVNGLCSDGYIDAAREASARAKMWGKVAVIVGSVLWGIYLSALIAEIMLSAVVSYY